MRHASGRRGVEGPGLEDPAAELRVAEEVLVGAGGEGWVARDQRPRWRVGRVVLGEVRRQATDHDALVGHARPTASFLGPNPEFDNTICVATSWVGELLSASLVFSEVEVVVDRVILS